MIEEITPLILTYNESANIKRTLQQLTWAKNIIIIDSYSTDDTLNIVRDNKKIQVFQRNFDTHATQWNYGLEQVKTEWVLSLDADYFLTTELIAEIKNLIPDDAVNSYFIPFKHCVLDKIIRWCVLPPRQALFRKSKAIYLDDGHTQLLQSEGKVAYLKSYVIHHDRKSLAHWLWAQNRYMKLEVDKLKTTPVAKLDRKDKIRRQKVFAPVIVLFYCLFYKGLILDGWAGWYYTLQRVLVEVLLSIYLIEEDLKQF